MGSSKKSQIESLLVSTENWQRARKPEQKQQRQAAITQAARHLVDTGGVENATLSEIARQAGISKASCYRYYESREAILLDVFLQEVQDHTKFVTDALTPLAGSKDIAAITQVIVKSTLSRPRMLKLVSALWSVLEHNISESLITDFKRQFHSLSSDWANIISQVHPNLSLQQAQAFTTYHLLFLASAWQASNPPPAVKAVMQRAEFCDSRIEFEPLLENHTETLLRGMLAERKLVD